MEGSPDQTIRENPLAPPDERTWAMLAHLSILANLVTGLLGPVIALGIYLALKDRSRYVADQAMQSFLFQLVWWVGGSLAAGGAFAVSGILSIFVVGLLCLPVACLLTLVPVGALVYGAVGAVQASQGQDFEYWLIGDWSRRLLA